MSFTTEKNKTDSNKIVLVEIDFPIEYADFINYEAGIWFMNLTPGTVTVEGSDGQIGFYGDQNTKKYNEIGSLTVDNTIYLKVDDLDELRAQDSSFYYDNGNTTLYIHFEDWHHPLGKIIMLGIVNGFSIKDDKQRGAYYNDIYYSPRVLKIPNLTKRKDKLFFGFLQYQTGSISFINSDGFFEDLLETNNFYGQPVRVFLGFEGFEYEDFRQVYSGYIENYRIDFKKFTISSQDSRKRLSRTLPTRQFSLADYPDINEDNIDKNKPIAYGVVRNAPAILTNENGAEPFVFMFMDTTDNDAGALTAVYSEGVDITGSVLASDLSAGTFNLSDADTFDADDQLKTITCDFTGADGKANALDAVKDMMLIYDNKAFIASNYNLAEYNYETSIAADVGIYIFDDKPFNDVIGEAMVSINGIFFFQDDGKITVRTYDEDRSPRRTIERFEWLSDPSRPFPSDEFLTSVRINYNKDQEEDEYLTYLNKTLETATRKIFKQYKQKTIETLLTDESDAIALSSEIMSISSQIAYHVDKRKTKLQHIDLEIMDFIVADVSRNSVDFDDIEKQVYEIIGITKDLNTNKLSFDLIYVQDYEEQDVDYIQGDLYYDYIWGDRLHAITSF